MENPAVDLATLIANCRIGQKRKHLARIGRRNDPRRDLRHAVSLKFAVATDYPNPRRRRCKRSARGNDESRIRAAF